MPKIIAYKPGSPMRIQARKGSDAEKSYFARSALPGIQFPSPKAIAPGVSPAPLKDLIFHGGKTVAQIEYQNIYLGEEGDWRESDITNIEVAFKLATQDRQMNNVLQQYFPGQTVTCDPRDALIQNQPKPKTIDEPDVQQIVKDLYIAGSIRKTGTASTIFNLVLPRGVVLRLDNSSSLKGLGGYHGSVHFKNAGKNVTLYYSANVFSEVLESGVENGIDVFDQPWKNVVGTLYHEICEFRTDADVNDAISSGDNDFLGWMSRDGEECGDQPISANALNRVFQEVRAAGSTRKFPVQFMYSNAVHGAEGPIANPH
jgi:hypothetical protein